MNKKVFSTLAILLILSQFAAKAGTKPEVEFSKYFTDSTLRLDYIFAGTAKCANIYVDELNMLPHWAGRRYNLDSLILKGNGQIYVTDSATNKLIYCHSFSTLFHEWQTTEEAANVARSFENVFLVPFPRKAVNIRIVIQDFHGKNTAELNHKVSPNDILIRKIGFKEYYPSKYIQKSGSSANCIDIAFIAEGYTEEEMELFYSDCAKSVESILSFEPFKSRKDKFNFVAVATPSIESGVSIPHNNQGWTNTFHQSHYDTFYSDRYLTTSRLKTIHNALAAVEYEHIILLVNTENYGGGGIYNAVTLSAAHHPTARQVLVHELGHSFAGLADEYFYDDSYEPYYFADTEPWEPNITTLNDFESKWKDMLPRGTQIPTPTKYTGKFNYKNMPTDPNHPIYTEVGVFEGAGYMSKGAYRPVEECRMKINEAPDFCPVCKRAIIHVINFYTRH